MKDYKRVTVPKPWGKEYLVFEENNLAGWILHINQGQKTSLHCHPNKKTSLVVLEGEVQVNFLTSNHVYHKGDKIIIREGVFHSTKAIKNSILLETETPVDKSDLLRLKDSYGREYKPYESEVISRQQDEVFISYDNIDCTNIKNSSFLKLTSIKNSINNFENKDIIIFINGGIFSNSIKVAGIGDSLNMYAFDLLTKEFSLDTDSQILHIKFI